VPRIRIPSRSSPSPAAAGLPADCTTTPDGSLDRDDLEDVLQRERLEIQGVGDVEVGGTVSGFEFTITVR